MSNELSVSEVEVVREELSSVAPGSALYKAAGDPVMYTYGFAPALVNSVLIPVSARGVAQHERLVDGRIPIVGIEHVMGRAIDSIDIIFGIVFAGHEAERAAHALHELHRSVKGKMPDGSDYHAWNQHIWTSTWLVQVKGFMDAYGVLRGYDDEQHRLAVYRGFAELGRHFHVTKMPTSLEEYDAYWKELTNTTLVASEPARFLVEQTTPKIVKPSKMQWIPTFLWALLTLPGRRIARVGLLITLPEKLDSELGIRRSWIDRVERKLHQFFWRLLPRSMTSKIGPAYFRLRCKFGNPAWRNRYSRESLAARRQKGD